MANEELMWYLPPDVERTSIPGPFFIKRYPGSYSVVVLTSELVTCGGEGAKDGAEQLARALNEVWNNSMEEDRVKLQDATDASTEV